MKIIGAGLLGTGDHQVVDADIFFAQAFSIYEVAPVINTHLFRFKKLFKNYLFVNHLRFFMATLALG